MSKRVEAAVWDHSQAKGNDLTTLLAIADNADDDGYAFPGYEYLASKCRVSLRTVKYAVKRLLRSDELTLIFRGGRGRANQYRVEVQVLHSKPPVTGKPVKPDRVQNSVNRVQNRVNRVQPAAPQPREPSEPKDGSPSLTLASQELFDFWRQAMDKNGGTRFTRERKGKVRARLESGYDVDYIKQAIRNCARSDWHMRRGQHAQRDGRPHNDLILICQSDTKLENFHDMYPESEGDAWEDKGFLT